MDIAMPVMDGFAGDRSRSASERPHGVRPHADRLELAHRRRPRAGGRRGRLRDRRTGSPRSSSTRSSKSLCDSRYPGRDGPGARSPPGAPLRSGSSRSILHALGPRRRSRRHGLHACLAGWNAHRRAQPHAADRRSSAILFIGELRRALPRAAASCALAARRAARGGLRLRTVQPARGLGRRVPDRPVSFASR